MDAAPPPPIVAEHPAPPAAASPGLDHAAAGAADVPSSGFDHAAAGAADVPSMEPDEPPRAHAVDLGFATFLKSGIADSGVTGISPFVAADLGRDILLRIAGLVGQAPASGLHLTWLAGRLDMCSENAGNYAAGSGLRFDLCGGADVGATLIPSTSASQPQTQPFIDVGPSFGLRAELGPNLAFLLRAGAGINVVRNSFVDSTGASFQPPLLTLDVEVALSWTLSDGRPHPALSAAAK